MNQGDCQNAGRRWQELAECGQYEQAFELVKKHLERQGGDVEALNDAGTILFCLCRGGEAIGYLERAAKIADGDKAGQILWNLSEAYLQEGRCAEAWRLFERMDEFGVLNVDVLNRAADVFLKKGALGGSIEMLLWSLQKCQEQEILHPMTEIIRGKRPKVGIVSGRAGSVGALADWLGRRFIVEVCEGESFSKVCSLAESCGMCIFYGCDESLIRAAHQNKNCRKVFVLRSEDIYGDQIEYVGFGQSDEIVVAGPQTAVDTLKERAKLSGQGPRVVRADEAVDFQRCVFTSRSRGKRLAAMGPFDAESNVMFLLQCIQKLHYIDRDFRLYLAGGFTGRAVEEYVRGMIGSLGLEGAVFLDGPVANEVSWLKDKHYFVSADISGAGMGHIWSAMACGLRPVVHRFPGADDMLDAEFLFNISEEFCVQVQSCGYEPLRYRRFVEQRQKQYGQFKAVNDALLRLERQMILSDSSVGGDDEKQRVDSKLSSVSREVSSERPAALPWERSDLSSVCGRENN